MARDTFNIVMGHSYLIIRRLGFILVSLAFLCGTVYYEFSGTSHDEKTSVFNAREEKLTFEKASSNSDSNLRQEDRQELEYKTRLARYQNVCAVRKREVHARNRIFFYKNPISRKSFGFCTVPKAGVTFWRRILQFLNMNKDKSNITVSSPFDIRRFDVYAHPLVRLNETPHTDHRMANALRFFFVRDPYARLVSAYMDKIFLPQERIKRCAQATSFAEFIEKRVLSGNVDDVNPHWRPVYTVCDPCTLFPRFIGKQETFSKDSEFILTKIGLQYLMTNQSHNTYVLDEIKQMVHYAYSAVHSSKNHQKCFDDVEIGSLLWKAFQVNGYLAPSSVFPKHKVEIVLRNNQKTTNVPDKVTEIVFKEQARANLSREQHSKQKRDMMIQMYSTLTKDAMERLAGRFDMDFSMFGYDKYPRDLFPWKYQ